MLEGYFKNSSHKRINNIIFIDKTRSNLDNFAKFCDLEFIDLSNNYKRTSSIYINFLLVSQYLRNNNVNNCLIVGSDFLGNLDLDFFYREDLISNNFLFILTTQNKTIFTDHVCIMNTPPKLIEKEFQNKLFAHFQKIIEQDFLYIDSEFPKKCYNLETLSQISDCEDEYFQGNAQLSKYRLDFIFKRDKNFKSLIILNQAAVARTRDLPIFQRWKWINDIKGCVLILNDPFLYKNIKFKTTWWVGDKETDIIKEFIKQLQNLLEKLEIPANKVFFFGSSAGGFASLQQATCLEGSTAIIDIAQTNLFKFEQQQELNFLSTQLFGCRISELEPKFKYRFNAIERIKIENKKINIYILQNTADTHHLLRHSIPLVNHLKNLNQCKFKFLIYETIHPIKGGHIPLSRRNTVELLNKIISYGSFCHNDKFLETNALKVVNV